MRIIDGMHRLRAAQLNGESCITARLLDDDDKTSYLRSISANVSHGLPLSLTDRRAAALELISMFPHCSDRSIGRAAGITGKTVGSLRKKFGGAMPATRTGRDGRIRPIDNASAKRAVTELITQNPEASLREIARNAGVSPNTVRSIRQQMTATPGQDDNSDGQNNRSFQGKTDSRTSEKITETLLTNLRNDPALRYSETGRLLLRLLHQEIRNPVTTLVDSLPPHCLPSVANVAWDIAQQWMQVSEMVRSRATTEVA
ncbi:hypothetical protein [Actinoplanes derwentensis]